MDPSHAFSRTHWVRTFQQGTNYDNRLRFDKVTGSLKVGTFLRERVVQIMYIQTVSSGRMINSN